MSLYTQYVAEYSKEEADKLVQENPCTFCYLQNNQFLTKVNGFGAEHPTYMVVSDFIHKNWLSAQKPFSGPMVQSFGPLLQQAGINIDEVYWTSLVKCPTCKKICLMNINKDKLLFSFECTNIHKNNNINKIFKKCKTVSNEPSFSYNSELAEINLSKEPKKINNKDNNTSKMTNATLQKLYIILPLIFVLSMFKSNDLFDSYIFVAVK